jgi:hypothetical protein
LDTIRAERVSEKEHKTIKFPHSRSKGTGGSSVAKEKSRLVPAPKDKTRKTAARRARSAQAAPVEAPADLQSDSADIMLATRPSSAKPAEMREHLRRYYVE